MAFSASDHDGIFPKCDHPIFPYSHIGNTAIGKVCFHSALSEDSSQLEYIKILVEFPNPMNSRLLSL